MGFAIAALAVAVGIVFVTVRLWRSKGAAWSIGFLVLTTNLIGYFIYGLL